MTLQYNFLRFIPIPILLRTLQVCAMMPVQVLKYSVLIFQAPKMRFLRRWSVLDRCQSSLLLLLLLPSRYWIGPIKPGGGSDGGYVV